jgi:hypothetical protein
MTLELKLTSESGRYDHWCGHRTNLKDVFDRHVFRKVHGMLECPYPLGWGFRVPRGKTKRPRTYFIPPFSDTMMK